MLGIQVQVGRLDEGAPKMDVISEASNDFGSGRNAGGCFYIKDR